MDAYFDEQALRHIIGRMPVELPDLPGPRQALDEIAEMTAGLDGFMARVEPAPAPMSTHEKGGRCYEVVMTPQAFACVVCLKEIVLIYGSNVFIHV